VVSADRRPPQTGCCRTARARPGAMPQRNSSRSTSSRRKWIPTSRSWPPWVRRCRLPACPPLLEGMGGKLVRWRQPTGSNTVNKKRDDNVCQDGAEADEQTLRRWIITARLGALRTIIQGAARRHFSSTKAPTRSTLAPRRHRHVQAAQAPRPSAPGGVMGIGHGAIRSPAAVETGKPGAPRSRATRPFGFFRHGDRDHSAATQLPVCNRHLQQ